MVPANLRRLGALIVALSGTLASCGTAGGDIEPIDDPPATSEIIEVPVADATPTAAPGV